VKLTWAYEGLCETCAWVGGMSRSVSPVRKRAVCADAFMLVISRLWGGRRHVKVRYTGMSPYGMKMLICVVSVRNTK